jgi:hypothetical protein
LYGCGGSSDEPSPSNGAPTLAGFPAETVWQGDRYVFVPSALDPDQDALVFDIENRPPWTVFDPVSGRLEGTPATVDVGTRRNIHIGVSDGRHHIWLPPFDLTVMAVSNGSVTVTWEAPVENTDNSPLNDLAGFNVYWGTNPDVPAGVVPIADTGIRTYLFRGLPPGVYYFATTALNSFGVESEPSDPAVIVVRDVAL